MLGNLAVTDFVFWCLLQAAVGFDYEGKTEKHASQKGVYVKYMYLKICCQLRIPLLQVHLVWGAYKHILTYYNLCNVYVPLDYSKGFGGKYGVQKDRVDQVRVWI